MFDNIEGSVEVVVGGRTELVPSRADYIQALHQRGLIDSENNFADHPDLVEAVYYHWQRQPQVACAFARKIAENPGAYGVHTKVVCGLVDVTAASTFAQAAASFIEETIARPEGEAASVLLPGVLNVSSLVAFCSELTSQGGWTYRAYPNPSDHLKRVYLELKRKVGVDNHGTDVLSEVLGFGPFEFLPLTRRAPITALTLRTKPERARRPKSLLKKPRAHLADLLMPTLDESRLKLIWRQTEQARLQVLGGDDSAARARVTFAIPQENWHQYSRITTE